MQVWAPCRSIQSDGALVMPSLLTPCTPLAQWELDAEYWLSPSEQHGLAK